MFYKSRGLVSVSKWAAPPRLLSVSQPAGTTSTHSMEMDGQSGGRGNTSVMAGVTYQQISALNWARFTIVIEETSNSRLVVKLRTDGVYLGRGVGVGQVSQWSWGHSEVMRTLFWSDPRIRDVKILGETFSKQNTVSAYCDGWRVWLYIQPPI